MEKMYLKLSTREIWPRDCWLGNLQVLTVRKACCQNLKLSVGTIFLLLSLVKILCLTHKCMFLFPSAGFTSKLEGMFKDMELSRDINSAFKQHVSHLVDNDGTILKGDKIDLTVNVLSMAFWPTYTVMNVIIPPYMLKYQDIFNKFYQVCRNLS